MAHGVTFGNVFGRPSGVLTPHAPGTYASATAQRLTANVQVRGVRADAADTYVKTIGDLTADDIIPVYVPPVVECLRDAVVGGASASHWDSVAARTLLAELLRTYRQELTVMEQHLVITTDYRRHLENSVIMQATDFNERFSQLEQRMKDMERQHANRMEVMQRHHDEQMKAVQTRMDRTTATLTDVRQGARRLTDAVERLVVYETSTRVPAFAAVAEDVQRLIAECRSDWEHMDLSA